MNYSCHISCSKNSLQKVRSFVKSSLGNHKIPETDVAAMVLAIDEIVANLIIHSHHCNMEDSLEIRIQVEKDHGVFFRIYDNEEIFDISQYESPTLEELKKSKRKGGLGLILVKRIMDEINIVREEGKNCCCLYKKVQSQ